VKPGFYFTALLAVGLMMPWALVNAQPAPAATTPTTRIENVNARDAAKAAKSAKILVLDARTPKEFAAGHIAGALNVDFNATDFAEKLSALDRGQTYLLYCASGRRSTLALKECQRLGFRHVIHLQGGIKAWQTEALPLEK